METPTSGHSSWAHCLAMMNENPALEHAAALELLNMAAWMAPDQPIPRTMFLDLPGLPVPIAVLVADPRRFRRGLERLRSGEFIRFEADSFQINSNAQFIVRKRLENEQDRLRWGKLALVAVEQSFPEVDDWLSLDSDELPAFGHAAVTSKHRELRLAHPALCATLCSRLGDYARVVTGKTEKAKAIYKKALDILDKGLGPRAPEAASILRQLAKTDITLGNPTLAQRSLQHAIKLLETQHGTDSPHLIEPWKELGSLLCEVREVKGARRAFERALHLAKADPQTEGSLVADCLNRLGHAQMLAGDLPEALKSLHQALELAETLEPGSQLLLVCLNHLALLRQKMGDVEGAREDLQRALDLHDQLFGKEHHNRSILLANRATMQSQTDQGPLAIEACEEELRQVEMRNQDDHPAVVQARFNLALALKATGDLVGARQHLEQALELQEMLYGPDSPNLAHVLQALGKVLFDLGNYPASHKVLLRALPMHAELHGERSDQTGMDLFFLGCNQLHLTPDNAGFGIRSLRMAFGILLETKSQSEYFMQGLQALIEKLMREMDRD